MCRLSSQKSDETITCVHSLPGYLAKWILKSDMWTIAMSGFKIFNKWKHKRENFVQLQYEQESFRRSSMRTGEWRRGHKYLPSISCFTSSYNIPLPASTKIRSLQLMWVASLPSQKIKIIRVEWASAALPFSIPNPTRIRFTQLDYELRAKETFWLHREIFCWVAFRIQKAWLRCPDGDWESGVRI